MGHGDRDAGAAVVPFGSPWRGEDLAGGVVGVPPKWRLGGEILEVSIAVTELKIEANESLGQMGWVVRAEVFPGLTLEIYKTGWRMTDLKMAAGRHLCGFYWCGLQGYPVFVDDHSTKYIAAALADQIGDDCYQYPVGPIEEAVKSLLATADLLGCEL
jgi:hypothetical protein